MKIIRNNIFETNSSSTHSLVLVGDRKPEDYMAKNSTILVRFINTDDESVLSSLEDKVSYLVSHIINNYKYNSANYQDLISDVENDYDFRYLSRYVSDKYNKRIAFPEKYEGDLDEIVSINHQLIESSLDSVLEDIVNEDRDYLGEVLAIDKAIQLGRD